MRTTGRCTNHELGPLIFRPLGIRAPPRPISPTNPLAYNSLITNKQCLAGFRPLMNFWLAINHLENLQALLSAALGSARGNSCAVWLLNAFSLACAYSIIYISSFPFLHISTCLSVTHAPAPKPYPSMLDTGFYRQADVRWGSWLAMAAYSLHG